MKYLKYSLLIIIAISCKTVEVEKEINLDVLLNEAQISIEFRKYMREFKQDAYGYGPFQTNYDGKSLKLQFYNSKDNTQSVTDAQIESNIITIFYDFSYWNSTDYNERKRLIYRTLMNVLFNRNVENGCIGSNKYPKSIISNSIDCSGIKDKSTIFFCTPYKEYYLRELFHPETPAPSWANSSIQPCETPKNILATFKLTNPNSTAKRIDFVMIETGKTSDLDKNQLYYTINDPKSQWNFDIGDICERGKEYTLTFATTKSTVVRKFVYDEKDINLGSLPLD